MLVKQILSATSLRTPRRKVRTFLALVTRTQDLQPIVSRQFAFPNGTFEISHWIVNFLCRANKRILRPIVPVQCSRRLLQSLSH